AGARGWRDAVSRGAWPLISSRDGVADRLLRWRGSPVHLTRRGRHLLTERYRCDTVGAPCARACRLERTATPSRRRPRGGDPDPRSGARLGASKDAHAADRVWRPRRKRFVAWYSPPRIA